LEAIKLLLSFRVTDFWKKINGNFLLAVVGGLLTSLVTVARLTLYFLEHCPIRVWAFFFGLILISAPLILRTIRRWNVAAVVIFMTGIVIAYMVTVLSPTQSPEGLWFIFICGALAICAMILPGISGAFILLLISKYEFIIRALTEVNLPVIIVFATGCVIGIIACSWVLTWILDHYHDITIALLAGFMLGSLNKVWPWKEVISYRMDSDGNQVPVLDKSILPGQYLTNTGDDPLVFQAILFAALGVIIVLVIEKVAERL